MTTTRAAVLRQPNVPLLLEDLTVPVLQAGQVLVRMQAAGLCRTQLHEVRGWKGEDRYLPHLLGHEGVGEVVAVADDVRKVTPGERVAVTWLKGKGADAGGCQYLSGKKPVNAGACAVFTELAVLSENRVVSIPADVPQAVAAILGCAVATGMGAVDRYFPNETDRPVAIFGVGGIGASALIAAVQRGYKHVVAVDINDDTLDWARTLGATACINARDSRSLTLIHDIVPDGVAVALEASGAVVAIEEAFRSLATDGLLVIAGHPPAGSTVSFDPFDFIKGKRVVGTWGGQTQPDVDLLRYIEDFQQGRLPLDRLVSNEYPLAEINEALLALEQGNVGRIIINIDPT